MSGGGFGVAHGLEAAGFEAPLVGAVVECGGEAGILVGVAGEEFVEGGEVLVERGFQGTQASHFPPFLQAGGEGAAKKHGEDAGDVEAGDLVEVEVDLAEGIVVEDEAAGEECGFLVK